MSDTSPFGFGRFVPGFDFLQNLAKGSAAGMPSMPAMSSWVAPTVSVEELEKRIEELKAVQFWLEQNTRALAATVQALEVQKMTLATLKGMNMAMGDLAGAFAAPAPAAEPARASASAPTPAPAPARAPTPPPVQTEPEAELQSGAEPSDKAAAAAPGLVDPMQWWTALSSQFQQIATSAMQDGAQHMAIDATRGMAAEALKTATGMASHLAAQGVQGVQDATRMAVGAATAAVPRAASARGKASAPAKPAASKRPAAKASATPARKAAVKSPGAKRPAAKKAAAPRTRR